MRFIKNYRVLLVNLIAPLFTIIFIMKFWEYRHDTASFQFWFNLLGIPFGIFMSICQSIVIYKFGFDWPNKPEAKLF
jgi:hypothetical protein